MHSINPPLRNTFSNLCSDS